VVGAGPGMWGVGGPGAGAVPGPSCFSGTEGTEGRLFGPGRDSWNDHDLKSEQKAIEDRVQNWI